MNFEELYRILNIILTLAPDAVDAVKKALEDWGKATGNKVDLSKLRPIPKDKHLEVDAEIDAKIERLFNE